MSFSTEPTAYHKTVLSDLQGAWSILRDAVVQSAGFPDWQQALFHIDEAMSWESVRNLEVMRQRLLLVRNKLRHAGVPDDVVACLEDVNAVMDETLEALRNGEID
ncbi:hypothetical protein G3480_23275 [Thiorhodococcus mannitoliphagus]|uniref:Uncharacterized protein n=1 Tax=Thiorhodococcus mannitoliphagus TaxID=329406 RepID=A0A6P1E1U4_9GAMM|nr:hypothetical protein [Thiorhodococcus mannitoliphagus]NEX23183.1 hypothetical protein [Thiorhodococcus mannitoliphagus]